MSPHGHPGVPAEAIERQHEQRDLPTRTLVWGLVGLAALTAAAAWSMVALFDVLQLHRQRQQAPPSPLVQTQVVPPKPRLEPIPGQLLQTLRTREQLQLTTYAWLDREAGIARIPVRRAMEILAERGLPARSTSGTAALGSGRK